jgi:hypothetical protein
MVVLMYERSLLKQQRKRLGGDSSNEVYLNLKIKKVATDEFCCIMTISSTTSTPLFLEYDLLDASSLIA